MYVLFKVSGPDLFVVHLWWKIVNKMEQKWVLVAYLLFLIRAKVPNHLARPRRICVLSQLGRGRRTEGKIKPSMRIVIITTGSLHQGTSLASSVLDHTQFKKNNGQSICDVNCFDLFDLWWLEVLKLFIVLLIYIYIFCVCVAGGVQYLTVETFNVLGVFEDWLAPSGHFWKCNFWLGFSTAAVSSKWSSNA